MGDICNETKIMEDLFNILMLNLAELKKHRKFWFQSIQAELINDEIRF